MAGSRLRIVNHIAVILMAGYSEQQSSMMQKYSMAKEKALRSLLFRSYETMQRPDEIVSVWASLTLLTVNDLDIRNQVLSISGYFSLVWRDSRLQWYHYGWSYAMIRFMFSTEEFLWRPALIIDNSVDDLSVINDKHIPMRIINTGYVTWNPAGIYKVNCDSDTTFYPMDKQTCTLSISSWSYTSYEVRLFFKRGDPVRMGFYTENGEWEMLETSGVATSGGKSRGGMTFANLKFTFILRRRPMFHVLNTLFPVALMSLLSVMVFRLPAESGEKIGYSLTVLLAYAVYLTLISENIPSTSVHICYLSVYLTLTLAYGTLSVAATILVLSVYHKPDTKKIPNYIQSIVSCFLVPILCWKGCCFCCRRRKPRRSQVAPTKKPVISIIEVGHGAKEPQNIDESFEDDDEEEEEELTWHTLSMMLDSMFFMIFMFLTLASTFVYFGMLLRYYIGIQT